MRYGYFDDEGREYVITTPKTPVKWINYVGSLAFGGFVDQTGGSLICKGDPALNRIVKYLPQAPASDFKGETLYLRLHERDGLRVFSPYFVPTLDTPQHFECRVGLGYSRWVTEFHGIRCAITVFVPLGEACLVRDIRITNRRAEPVTIDAIPVVEYTHFDALKQFTNADWVPQTMQSDAMREADGHLVLSQCAFMKRDSARNYFTSSLPVSSFESDRRRFLGDNEYGTWRSPLALQAPELSNYEARRGDNIGALMHHLGELAPGESRRLITQLGQCADLAAQAPAIARLRDPAAVEAAFVALAAHWRDYLAVLEVKTPDPAFDSMVNVHNPRQCAMTLNWSRDLSLYQLGFGGRGLGFRDSSQDTMGAVAHDPQGVRALLRKLLQVQKRDGSAMHQFTPSTMEASAGDSREFPDRPKFYGDDHLWIVLAVAALLKETGDLAFLDEVLPFYDADENGVREEASVLEHLRRALDFTWAHRGAHGLPLLGFADWNDTVNLRAGAESNFIAPQYGRALQEMMTILDALGDEAGKASYEARYREMKAAVNRETWDGEWFVRYFDHEGRPLGSQRNEHGKIYINAQSWNVIAGFAEGERARTALAAVGKHLATANGLKLSAPGFDHYDPELGGISTYPPGAKENGGIFLHTNPWVMIAETMLGHGDTAFRYYQAINPAAKNDKLDEFESEPYCYPQNMLGDEHPQFGLARNSWLSGTASWTYQAATQYLLGIRATIAGLVVDPCLPKCWPGFSAKRRFRGARYAITVSNVGEGHGVRSVRVDGEAIAGTLLPLFASGEHRVEVEIG